MKDSRILVVDDEPANVRILAKVLERGGYEDVITTTDSEEAVELFREKEPDALLLDLVMPGMNGFEVMEAVRAELPPDSYLPILVLTGDASSETRQRALTSGATDFLTKPFDVSEVLARIGNLLGARRLHRQVKRHNAELEDRVRDRTRALEDARNATLRRLAIAAEFRDDVTGRHQERVGILSGLLAEELGLSSQEVETIQRAAPLHDVGKIGIPDAILLKPGKLTSQEYDLMKSHVRIGATILAGAEFPLLRLAEVISLHHHERWNGRGYLGLKGDEIPVAGRIVAVADVFDSLTSRRPYKPPYPREHAIHEVLSEEGEHFDPEVVRAFRRICDDGRLDAVLSQKISTSTSAGPGSTEMLSTSSQPGAS